MTPVHRVVVAGLGVAVGGSVGSFLNVCVWRLPQGLSLLRPGSRCPACGVAVSPRDNLPVVGWLLLRGRCRRCRGAISPRYPLVEAAVATLFGAAAWAETAGPLDPFDRGVLPFAAIVAYHWLLTALLVTAGLIEYDRRRDPAAIERSSPDKTLTLSRSPNVAGAVALAAFAAAAAPWDGVGLALNAGLLAVGLSRHVR